MFLPHPVTITFRADGIDVWPSGLQPAPGPAPLPPVAPPVPVTPAPLPPVVPTPVPGPVAPIQPATRLDAHMANVRALYNESPRGEVLSAKYLELGPAVVYKSALQTRILNEIFGGNAGNLARWADYQSFNPANAAVLTFPGEFMRLLGMANLANTAPE